MSKKQPKQAQSNKKAHTSKAVDGSSLKRKLANLRRSAGMTQLQLAQRLGTSRTHISRLESENSKVSPAMSTVQAYADAVGYEMEVNFVPK